MTEIDKFSRLELELELEERARERAEIDEAEVALMGARAAMIERTVETVRVAYSHGYSDAAIAKVLGVQRKVVNSYRLYGRAQPPKREATAPAG